MKVTEMQANKPKTLEALKVIEEALLKLAELGVNHVIISGGSKSGGVSYNANIPNLWTPIIYLDRNAEDLRNYTKILEKLDSHIEDQVRRNKKYVDTMKEIARKREAQDRAEYERLKAKFENQ